jgi:hypothetical protein
MQHSLENWADSHESLIRSGKTGPYYYREEVYRQLGL